MYYDAFQVGLTQAPNGCGQVHCLQIFYTPTTGTVPFPPSPPPTHPHTSPPNHTYTQEQMNTNLQGEKKRKETAL